MSLTALVVCILGVAGSHHRWETVRGPIHTWHPGVEVPSTVVLYVHGYRDDADSAFRDHHLAEQFAQSGLDALFVVPEAPSGPRQMVAWPNLEELLVEVARHHAASLPDSVLVLGHSGGNRTLKAWLPSPRVSCVILLDGFYGDPKPFERWLEARREARLIMVGGMTFAKAEAWRNGLRASLRERVSHQAAGCSHMEIVTAGRWISQLLRTQAET